jgi:hypothetical protein
MWVTIMDIQRMNECVVCEGLPRTSSTGVNKLNIHYSCIVIFIIMTNNETLRRIILRMVNDEYPMITDTKVVSYDNEGKYYYTIFLGIKPNVLIDLDTTELKQKVRELFNYIYPHDTLHSVSFYNPEPSYY